MVLLAGFVFHSGHGAPLAPDKHPNVQDHPPAEGYSFYGMDFMGFSLLLESLKIPQPFSQTCSQPFENVALFWVPGTDFPVPMGLRSCPSGVTFGHRFGAIKSVQNHTFLPLLHLQWEGEDLTIKSLLAAALRCRQEGDDGKALICSQVLRRYWHFLPDLFFFFPVKSNSSNRYMKSQFSLEASPGNVE